MFNQKSILILFVDRNRLQLYGGSLTGIVTIDVPETLVRDLEVIEKDGLYTLIKQWVKQYNITGSHLILVFSEAASFDKVFYSAEHVQMETDILKFLDMVPLESNWTKVYDVEKGKRAVAISKSLYEAIHQGFALQGLSTKAVIPAFALGPMSTKRVLDNELATYVAKKMDALVKLSLLDPQELNVSTPQEKRDVSGTTKKTSNLPLLLGAFGLLMIILIVVVLTQLH